MKVLYDKDMCALTGQCVMVAPDVFDFEGDDLVYNEHPDESQREPVEQAVRLCPMQALGLED